MRFAALSGSNTSDYVAAGRAVADSAAKSFAVQRKTGPDYGKLSQMAMKTQAEENVAGMAAASKVTKAGIKAYEGTVKQGNKIEVFNKGQEIKNKQKMAGSIAAVGKLAGVGYLASKDNTKGRERPKGDRQSIIDSFKASNAASNERYDDAAATLGELKSTVTGGSTPKKVTGGSTVASPTSPQSIQGMSDGWSRMSRVIKTGEGTLGDRGYTTQFTGRQFSDLSRHPAQINRSGDLASDAAGAYQFLSTTYNPAAKALGISDFSPQSQERVGKHLAQQRGMDTETVFTDKGSFLKELNKIAPEWASMPTLATGTSYYGQGGLSPDEAWKIYSGS